MTDPDLTSQEQVNKSIGMCRLHGLHNTEATLRALSAERDALKQSLEKALFACGDQARARGEAEGKLAASEMAGVVDGWKARAEALDAKLNEAVGILNVLLKEASITSNRGAVTGSHWTHLGVAILKTRAFLASLEGDKP